jgi:mono/diheme cytochrome c family protein
MRYGITSFAAWIVFAVLASSVLALAQPEGESVYQSVCARCHGKDGSAHAGAVEKMKVTDLRSDYVQNQSDEELFASIGHGMKHKQYPHGFLHRGLNDTQVREVISYVRGFRKAEGTKKTGKGN